MNPKRNNIVLIGFMGTGKSTVSRVLAERLGWQSIDTDAEIERQEGRKIAEMFAADGEAYFRNIETRVIAEVMSGKEQVVSTGGGAVLAEPNRQAMLAGGCVVALTADPDVIIERVRRDEKRPLLQGDVSERVHTLLANRRTAYDFADIKIDTSQLTVEAIVGIILEQYREEATLR